MTRGLAGGGLSRRAVLAGTGIAAGGTLFGAAGSDRAPASYFYGARQPGIATPALPFVSIAGFDVVARHRAGLVDLLRTWTRVAAEMTAESTHAVTFTFGFGRPLFAEGRFGLTDRRPGPLADLPSFPGDSIDPAVSNGDLCVQACATHPSAAHQAVRTLVNTGRTHAALRWRQTGFRDAGNASDPPGMFGFRDGTANLDVDDARATADHLWVSDGPAWLHGGTYLVVRRIRLLLDTWDRTAVAAQEAMIGRHRDSNRRIEGVPTAHMRLASPEANGGVRLLRRSYSYDAGVDPNGLLDSGLIFLCFQRDPQRQFVPIQRRLAEHDPLNGFSQHLASGVFACPPGVERGSWIGANLLS
ncbi:MAG TPA: Dyp-type peroxidase [Micromonosporaceae bacterium]|nr:Dyp-type peroxidase [Micromonosporaceae bacterium]